MPIWAREHLEEQGIPAFLMDAKTVAMNWALANAIGYIKLQVPSDQAATALDLRRQHRRARTDRKPLQDDGELIGCPGCGADIPEAHSTCTSCGWSGDIDVDPRPLEETAVENDEDSAGTTTLLATFRGMKRPVFWFILSPVILVPVFLAIAALVLIVQSIVFIVQSINSR